MGKENVAVRKKCFQQNNNTIFGWLVGDLFGIWLVWGWFDWFVGGLAGLWIVSSFTANGKLNNLLDIVIKFASQITDKDMFVLDETFL